MSSEARPPAAAPRRLHRAGILVLAVDALRDAALPMLVVGVVAITGGGLDADALVRALVLRRDRRGRRGDRRRRRRGRRRPGR